MTLHGHPCRQCHREEPEEGGQEDEGVRSRSEPEGGKADSQPGSDTRSIRQAATVGGAAVTDGEGDTEAPGIQRGESGDQEHPDRQHSGGNVVLREEPAGGAGAGEQRPIEVQKPNAAVSLATSR